MTELRLIIMIVMAAIIAVLIHINIASAGAYSVGKALVGLHERKHTGKLRSIVGVNPRRTPWCGAFVGYAVKAAGHAPVSGHLRAVNWAKWGNAVQPSAARKGDVVVIRTRRGHHVTLFAGHAGKGRFYGLGGNQSNRVKISTYSIRSIVAVRRAPGAARARSVARKEGQGPTLKELMETWRERIKRERAA